MVCCVSMENRKQEVKPSIADTHGAQPDSSRRLPDYQFISYLIALLNLPWLCGKCSSSRSPWVYMISHQISAKNSQDNMKLRAKASSVQRHCQSTMVVYMSCKKRTRLRCRCFCTTLQSPFLNTARRRTRRMLPGRKLRDLSKREINANIEIICH